MHGLRGHPQRTWGDNSANSSKHNQATSSSKTSSKIFSLTALFHKKRNNVYNPQADPFWPYTLLPADIRDARIWTYGYDADVVEGLFQANNQNSISKHGRDFAVKLER